MPVTPTRHPHANPHRRHRLITAVASVVLASCAPKTPPPPTAPVLSGPFPVEIVREGGASDLSIDFEEYELDNGMHVILSEDHSVPFVWVNLWYRVGSKDEEPGLTGFAHLFEHMMFQGSEHANGDYFGPLQAVGARINGTTNFDRTHFEGVPSEHLPPRCSWRATGWGITARHDARASGQ